MRRSRRSAAALPVALVALLLGGCDALLGFEEASALVTAPDAPDCMPGWAGPSRGPRTASAHHISWPYQRIGPVEWWSEGEHSLYLDLEQDTPFFTGRMSMSLQQDVSLPGGSLYVLRFDLFVLAASPGELGGRFTVFSGGDSIAFSLDGRLGSITGPHLGMETVPLSAGRMTLRLEVRISDLLGGYFKGAVDNVRFRKFADPMPVATVGASSTHCP